MVRAASLDEAAAHLLATPRRTAIIHEPPSVRAPEQIGPRGRSTRLLPAVGFVAPILGHLSLGVVAEVGRLAVRGGVLALPCGHAWTKRVLDVAGALIVRLGATPLIAPLMPAICLSSLGAASGRNARRRLGAPTLTRADGASHPRAMSP